MAHDSGTDSAVKCQKAVEASYIKCGLWIRPIALENHLEYIGGYLSWYAVSTQEVTSDLRGKCSVTSCPSNNVVVQD